MNLLSDFASKFNLRRYSKAARLHAFEIPRKVCLEAGAYTRPSFQLKLNRF